MQETPSDLQSRRRLQRPSTTDSPPQTHIQKTLRRLTSMRRLEINKSKTDPRGTSRSRKVRKLLKIENLRCPGRGNPKRLTPMEAEEEASVVVHPLSKNKAQQSSKTPSRSRSKPDICKNDKLRMRLRREALPTQIIGRPSSQLTQVPSVVLHTLNRAFMNLRAEKFPERLGVRFRRSSPNLPTISTTITTL